MTELQKLKADADAALDAAVAAFVTVLRPSDANLATFDANLATFDVAMDAADDARATYQNELKKQAKAPREPVKDEGNPIV